MGGWVARSRGSRSCGGFLHDSVGTRTRRRPRCRQTAGLDATAGCGSSLRYAQHLFCWIPITCPPSLPVFVYVWYLGGDRLLLRTLVLRGTLDFTACLLLFAWVLAAWRRLPSVRTPYLLPLHLARRPWRGRCVAVTHTRREAGIKFFLPHMLTPPFRTAARYAHAHAAALSVPISLTMASYCLPLLLSAVRGASPFLFRWLFRVNSASSAWFRPSCSLLPRWIFTLLVRHGRICGRW